MPQTPTVLTDADIARMDASQTPKQSTGNSSGALTDADITAMDAQSNHASGVLDSVERFGRGFWNQSVQPAIDAARGIGGAVAQAVTSPSDTYQAIKNSNLVQHPIDTTTQAVKDAYNRHKTMLDQARESFTKGDYDDAVTRAGNAMIPVLGPTIQASVDKARNGNVAEALGELSGLASTLALSAPGATESIVSKLPSIPGANRLYASALKPSRTLSEANRTAAIQTGLREGIPVSRGGFDKLGGLIDDLQDKVRDTIATNANAGATVDPLAVANRTDDAIAKFGVQVNPDADIAAIRNARDEFLRNNPSPIPVDQAQAMKTGTYQQLRKNYGKLSSATIEAQKALARGIKEELASQFPELGAMNARESHMIKLQDSLEDAVTRIENRDWLDFGATVAGGVGGAVAGPKGAVVMGILKKVLDQPNVKSRLAIALNHGVVPTRMIQNAGRLSAFYQALDNGTSPSDDQNQNQF